MGKGDYLGEFEQIVLLAVLRLDKNAYGVTIWEEIEKRTGRPVMIGAVYATKNVTDFFVLISSTMLNIMTPMGKGHQVGVVGLRSSYSGTVLGICVLKFGYLKSYEQ